MIYSQEHSSIGQRIKRFIFGGEGFKKEVKHEIRLLLLFTLGFTIAFTWRQTIFDATSEVIKYIFHPNGIFSLSILTSVLITLVSLILILVFSKILKDKQDHY
ncbi:MAG: hypothetical protein AABW80_04885 [Nanoarchaeota archaeon]